MKNERPPIPLLQRAIKLHPNQLKPVNEAIRRIMSDPTCGEEKRGDLAGVRVHKFRVADRQYLLAYEFDAETLTLFALGVHENFYRRIGKEGGVK